MCVRVVVTVFHFSVIYVLFFASFICEYIMLPKRELEWNLLCKLKTERPILECGGVVVEIVEIFKSWVVCRAKAAAASMVHTHTPSVEWGGSGLCFPAMYIYDGGRVSAPVLVKWLLACACMCVTHRYPPSIRSSTAPTQHQYIDGNQKIEEAKRTKKKNTVLLI
jgi:hypothetical protein